MSAWRLLGLLAWTAVRTVLAVGAAGVAAAGILWAWSGTQASLDWGWRQFAQPRGLQAEGLTGSLRRGLHAAHLRVQAGALEMDLWNVAIAWDPLALLDGQLRITGARALQVRLRTQEPRPVTAPRGPSAPSEAWPAVRDITIERLAVDHLAWEGAADLQASDLAASYRLDGARGEHHIALLHAVAGSGRYHGALRLSGGTRRMLDGWLQGEAQAPATGDGPTPRLALQAGLRGTADDIALDLRLQALTAGAAAPPSVYLNARITPRRAPYVSSARARVRHLDLSALWPQAPRTRLDGTIDVSPVQGTGWHADIDLANARPGPWDHQRLPLARLQAEGTWSAGIARVRMLRVRVGTGIEAGLIESSGRWRAGRGLDLALRIDRLRPGSLHSALSAGSDARSHAALAGSARARNAQGATAFDLALRTAVPRLPVRDVRDAAARAAGGPDHLAWGLQSLTVRGPWEAGQLQAQGDARGEVTLRGLPVRFEVQAHVARQAGAPAHWSGRVIDLRLAPPDPRTAPVAWMLRLLTPVDLRAHTGAGLVAGAGRAMLSTPSRRSLPPALVVWEPTRWNRGEFHSTGRVEGLSLAWLALSGRVPPRGDMVFDARWDIHLARTLRVSARLERVRGDITLLAETTDGLPVRVTAGVREARLALESSGEAVRVTLRWLSDQAGQVRGEVSTRLARGAAAGWHWPAQAPLAGRLNATLPRIAAWSALAPPGWRLRGSLAADIEIGGTRSEPRVAGPLRADDLSLRSVVDGIALRDGRLRARLDNRQLIIDALRWETGLREGTGHGTASGTLEASGTAGWAPTGAGGPAGLHAQFGVRLDRLRAIERSDRQVVLSGEVSGRIDPAHVTLEGRLHVDRARITVPDTPEPRLGEDVIVHNPPAGAAAAWRPAAPARRALRLAVDVDLGRDARVAGRGVDTGLQGLVHVSGSSFAQPRLVGTVHAVDGRYTAYGQRLELQRGLLRFTGVHDDPALDMLAVRTDLDRQVGVQVTGRARAPVFRLWSQAPATEAEKLSWLVLGRGAAAGGADTALLEQAAVSLLTRRAGLGKGGIAAAFGLDEVSVRAGGEQGAAITVGKRLGRRLYAAYERTLAGAVGTLYVFLDLGARLTLRAEAGDRTGLDLIYALSFDEPAAPARPDKAPRAPGAR